MAAAVTDMPTFRLSLSAPVHGVAWRPLAVTIWGVYLAFAQAGVNAGVQPVDLAFVRFATAGAIMLPWLLRRSPGTLGGVGWRRAAVLARPVFILVGASGFLFAPLSHGAIMQPAGLTMGGLVLGALVLRDRGSHGRQRIASLCWALLQGSG